MYYKNALEKLKINTHVFRVGTYKSAVEPFLRNDMSEAAKEANIEWLNALWADYKQQVAVRRGFAVDNFDETYAALLQKLQAAEGDLSQYAVNAGLADTIKTREAFRRDLIAIVGENEDHSYNHVTFNDYADLTIPAQQFTNPLTDKVAVVVARGVIVDGSAKAGTIGGDSTAALLRKARHDDKIKAVVLRVDSPGGSAYASEVIGQEISEQLDIVPAQLRVRVTRRPRYGCRTCEGAVITAAAPARPIDGGMPTEAVIAHILVSKFCDSLPLYRQAQMLARQGMALDRSTLSHWVGTACWWLAPRTGRPFRPPGSPSGRVGRMTLARTGDIPMSERHVDVEGNRIRLAEPVDPLALLDGPLIGRARTPWRGAALFGVVIAAIGWLIGA